MDPIMIFQNAINAMNYELCKNFLGLELLFS